MKPLALTDIPKMPKGFERYQGMTLWHFASAHPLILKDAMIKGGWELDAQAKAELFPSQAKIKRPSKYFG